jgi:hypothetical protein
MLLTQKMGLEKRSSITFDIKKLVFANMGPFGVFEFYFNIIFNQNDVDYGNFMKIHVI